MTQPANAYALPRILVLLSVLLLVVGRCWLGSTHPLCSVGIIALVGALIFAQAKHRQHLHHAALLSSSAFGIGIAVWIYWLGYAQQVAALLPAICQALLAWLVWRTLQPGHTPAIEKMARAILADEQPLPTVMAAYARRSTWLWLGLFACLAAFNAWLSLRAMTTTPLNHAIPNNTSSFAQSLFDVAMAGAVIMAEFFYRRWRYAEHSTQTLRQFCVGLSRVRPLSVLLS